MSGVWLLAAVMTMPVFFADVLIVLLYGQRVLRRKRNGSRVYRSVFSMGMFIVTCHGASATIHAVAGIGPQWLSICAGAAVFAVANFALVATAGVLSEGALPPLMRSADEHLLSIAELSVGASTGLIVVHQPWLSWLALPVVLVLQRSAAVRQLQVQAVTDSKTGLLNATAWNELAQRQLSQAVRGEQSASLLLLDLDHFKRINDTYGHLAGDDVLRRVADAIKGELREYDSVGRFGGEEFVAFLPGVDREAARSIAERLRGQIAALDVEAMADLRLSASIGVSTRDEHGAEVDELLRAADEALYAAKRGGRNRVELACPAS